MILGVMPFCISTDQHPDLCCTIISILLPCSAIICLALPAVLFIGLIAGLAMSSFASTASVFVIMQAAEELGRVAI